MNKIGLICEEVISRKWNFIKAAIDLVLQVSDYGALFWLYIMRVRFE